MVEVTARLFLLIVHVIADLVGRLSLELTDYQRMLGSCEGRSILVNAGCLSLALQRALKKNVVVKPESALLMIIVRFVFNFCREATLSELVDEKIR